MKKMKKLASLLLAAIMVLAMAVPAAAETITIKNTNPAAKHTYEAYAVFTGDLAANGKLSNLRWGAGITAEGQQALLSLYGIDKSLYTGDNAEQHLLEALSEAIEKASVSNPSGEAQKIADTLAPYLDADNKISSSGGTEGTDYEIEVSDGYYVVVDADIDGTDYDVYSRYIVEVSGNSKPITPKSDKPSVDKQVQDNDDSEYHNKLGENGRFGETADHEIGEIFQFKLIANLPKSAEMNAYESYKLIFHDTMSAGLTFDSIESVIVYDNDGETPVATIESSPADNGYETNDTTDSGEWSLTIPDILKHLNGKELGAGYKVEVIYKAHLNENALVTVPGDPAQDNPNTVKLEYSNNPNVDGEGDTGTTPEDTVHVFTFTVPAIKYADDTTHPLAGAGFTVTPKSGKNAGTPIKFSWNADKNAYIPDTNGSETIESKTDGTFTINGLDVGEYTVTETVTPEGYNTLDPFTIVITADHTEVEGAATVNSAMKKDNDSTKKLDIINKSGATLPETGGIGTTIFYVLGSILVLGAVILLVTKKRMSVEK